MHITSNYFSITDHVTHLMQHLKTCVNIVIFLSIYSAIYLDFILIFDFFTRRKNARRVKRIVNNAEQNSETRFLVHCLFASS